MVLLNPKKLVREYHEEKTKDIMEKTVEFFENKGLQKLKEDDHQCVWFEDFLEFQKKKRYFPSCRPCRNTAARIAGGTPGGTWNLMNCWDFTG